MKSYSIMAMTAAALCLSAGIASAQTTPLTFTQSGNDWYANNLKDVIGASSFTDYWTFKNPVQPLPAAGATNVISLSSKGALIFDLFQLMDTTKNTLLGHGAIGSTTSMFSFDLPIGNDSYSLDIGGHLVSPATSGSYSGNMVISQVPEPKNYAMLLAGLGLLAFIARRRKTGFF